MNHQGRPVSGTYIIPTSDSLASNLGRHSYGLVAGGTLIGAAVGLASSMEGALRFGAYGFALGASLALSFSVIGSHVTRRRVMSNQLHHSLQWYHENFPSHSRESFVNCHYCGSGVESTKRVGYRIRSHCCARCGNTLYFTTD